MRIRDWSSDVCSSDLVWYDHDMKKNEGTKWLRDVRQWWRASGRSMSFPAKGVTGATRAPGTHKISFSRAQLGAATPGDYVLVIEAAREVGGRRSEEHTSELQSLMRISYAVFCLKKKKKNKNHTTI